MPLIEFWLNHSGEFLDAILRHLALVVASTGIAVAAGVPLGVISYRNPRVGAPLIGLANIVQTIPSIAMFGFLIPMPLIGGIGAQAAVIALILYALLPVMRTTASGLKSIDPSAREAGLAMGMTSWELLYQVELPLAQTAILAGVRVATVVGVGTATIAAAVGAGGLGQYIFRGVDSVDSVKILAGAIPAAALALVADLALTWLERRLAPDRTRSSRKLRIAAMTATAALLLIIGGLIWSEISGGQIVIGSKGFTEQVILGELLAQTIERSTKIKVQRKLNLGDTLVCETAMQKGKLDLYVEYTGTALTAIFKQSVILDSAEVNRRVGAGYAATGRVMLPRLGLKTISEAVKYALNWRAGFGSAFLDREDGYRGLVQAYGLKFREVLLAMNLSLTYRALANGQVHMIPEDATSGLIANLDLYPLEDNRRYFPPYN